MSTNPLRAAVLASALSLLALAGPVAAASAAEVEGSQITAPASTTYVLDNESEPSSTFTVEGSVTAGSGKVSLRCYFGKGAESYITLAHEVTPEPSGSFSAKVELKSLVIVTELKLLAVGPCVLRAVPVGDKEAHPPGTPAEEAKDPFKGQRIVGSRSQLFEESSGNYNYELEPNTLAGYLDITSVGEWGLRFSNLFAPETLAASNDLFDGNAALYEKDNPPSGSPTRSELQIDGANAYSPATARRFEESIKASLPGAPHVTVTETFDEGLATVTEVDPIVRCSPSTAFEPTSSSCTSFVSTGVELERAWQTSSDNQVAEMTDTWRSTDGAAHSLNALYDQATENSEEGGGGAYQFPGTTAFAATTKGETVALPAGLGTIYYKEDARTLSEGDGVHPQGAIVYDTLPSAPISVYRGTAAKGVEPINGFEMPYQATIPATGSYTLRMGFIQAYKLSEVEKLASQVRAKYPASSPPTVTIASPTNNATVSTPTITVKGTATDVRGITSFTVDGQPVSVGVGGAWATTVTLKQGANTITAVATDQAGYATPASVTVTYAPPPPPVAHAAQVGVVRANNGQVTFTIVCNGPAGSTCEVESTITTVERTRRGRIVAVVARRHHGFATRSTTVTVGSSKVTVPAGQRVTIGVALNATGKALLAQFGTLPVHLRVVSVSAGHRATVIAQNLVVTPHHRARRHHHHHHHRHRR